MREISSFDSDVTILIVTGGDGIEAFTGGDGIEAFTRDSRLDLLV